MRCSTHLIFFFNIILLYFAKNTSLEDDYIKEIFKMQIIKNNKLVQNIPLLIFLKKRHVP